MQTFRNTAHAPSRRGFLRLGAPVLAVKRTTYFRALPSGAANATGWGNYSSTGIHPLDPALVWTCQEYATSEVERRWGTAWAAFRLDESK